MNEQELIRRAGEGDRAALGELIRRAGEGDRAALGELIRAHERQVYALTLRWTGNPEDALDLSQETFLRVFRFFDSFDGRSSFSTWVYRIAVNVCKDFSRRAERTPTRPLEQEEPDGGEPQPTALPDERYEPAAVAEQRERSRLLREAIEALPEQHRMMVLLRDVRGLSYREIAEVLSLEEGTVKSRISRARTRLRETLRQHGNFFETDTSKSAKGGGNSGL